MNIRNRLIPLKSTLAGVALAFTIGVGNANANTTNLLSLTTFELDALPGWGYGYFYGLDAGVGWQMYTRNYYLPDDYEMTNAMWAYTFDLSGLEGYNGYGTGTGGPFFRTDPDPTSFVSTNRVDYIFSWDARAEGLKEDVTSVNLEMQLQLFNAEYPDRDDHKILQINIPFSAGSNWGHYSFTLEDGGVADNTSEDVFALWHMNVTGVQFNVNSHMPSDAYDFDGDNAFYLDNLKLEVVVKPPSTNPPPVLTPVTIVDWDLDDKTVWSEWHYNWSQNDFLPLFTAGNNNNGNDPNTVGVEGSSGWFLTMDNSAFLGADPVPAWAGGGTGGNGPTDFSHFNTGDLASYRVSFEARVEGLMADRQATTCVLQLHISAPDDTIQPPDDDTNGDFLVRLDFPISMVNSNWQSYSLLFSKANAGGGSKANFVNYFQSITGLNLQWQIENATSLNDWDYDSDNSLFIDNIKIERLYPPPLEIVASAEGGEITLTWAPPVTGTVKLQSAPAAEGPYTDVPGATTPYAAPVNNGARFFRTIWVP